MLKFACLAMVVVVAPVLAADHPDLTGTWLLDLSHSQVTDSKLKSETLQIKQKEDMVAMTDDANSGGKERKLEFDCLADGSTCKAKDASVSVYYNGPILVVLEMRHNNEYVIKKRLKLSEDGKTLTIEVAHVSPPGNKDDNLTFVKQ